ncbi:Crp/Fnr family transcriptional regulator [Belliella marina]|uniref:Crp/Fnr family transcriptional regulator n=1 Tax=Belliella marina TaxID=1644146 RepID=A0ABW4VNF4_9BACT
MDCPLYKQLTSFVKTDQKELSEIIRFFEKRSIGKKEDILEMGGKCDAMYFVEKGCLYLYTVDDAGNEKTIQFAIENWWLSDVLAFRNQTRSQFGIRAALKSEVLEISYPSYQGLLANHPVMEEYFRKVYEIAFGAALMRFKFLFTHSKEDIYHHFNDNFPDFVNRVPQYLLASYLNLTPEYLSQIRKKATS